MKWLIIALLILAGIYILLRLYASSGNVSSSVPDGHALGVRDGKLSPCRSAPNCVSSFSDPEDEQHYAKSITYTRNVENPMQRLVSIIAAMPGTEIKDQTNIYLRVEFTSKMVRFVDDVEFLIHSEQRVIDFRSASRIGQSDFGVNLKRIEFIRTQFEN